VESRRFVDMILNSSVSRLCSPYTAVNRLISRTISLCNTRKNKQESSAIVIGCHEDLKLTEVGMKIDNQCNGRLLDLLKISDFKAKPGKARVFYGLSQELNCVAVAGLGKEAVIADGDECINERKENVRSGIGAAVKQLQSLEVDHIEIDHCSEPVAAAEGATLANYVFNELKSKKEKKQARLNLLQKIVTHPKDVADAWSRGVIMADSQNFARYMMELPSNYKTPTKLANIIVNRLSDCKGVETIVRDKKWIEDNKMGCFLGVAQGSSEPPVLVEMKYTGSSDRTAAIVGKGVTFDTGGISIKPSANMAEMKGDMGGAACTVATIEAASKLGLDINTIGIVALTENMPSGTAVKPGDVLTAMNGKTVEVDNTDAEGRLILADAILYAHSFNPDIVINIATLTGAIRVALGSGASGTFTNSNRLWSLMNEAGYNTGDRVWRMPLFKQYTKDMDCSLTADLRNTQKTVGSAGSCTAAAFLKEFVSVCDWAHLDIAGVMSSNGELSYLSKGMTGMYQES